MRNNFKEDKDSKIPLKRNLIFLSMILCIGLVTAASTSLDSSDSFIVGLDYTLSPIGSGITSSYVNVTNDSWLSLDGDDEINSIADSDSLHLSSNFTFSGWVNITSLHTLQSHYFDKYDGAGGYEIYIDNSTHQIRLRYQNTTNDVYVEDICPDPVDRYGQWVNVVISFNSTTAKCYFDGVLNQTTITTGSIEPNSRSADYGNGFNGTLDEWRLYNSTLNDSQVLEIYNSGRFPNSSLPSSNLILWNSFEEGSGSTVYDKSTFGNNGTISGASWDNDGVNVTLTPITDYTINSSTGLFEIINSDYSWTLMNVFWEYVVIEPDCSDEVISLLELAVLFLALAVMLFSIGYGIYNQDIKGLITAFIGVVIGGVLIPVTMDIINSGCAIT